MIWLKIQIPVFKSEQKDIKSLVEVQNKTSGFMLLPAFSVYMSLINILKMLLPCFKIMFTLVSYDGIH